MKGNLAFKLQNFSVLDVQLPWSLGEGQQPQWRFPTQSTQQSSGQVTALETQACGNAVCLLGAGGDLLVGGDLPAGPPHPTQHLWDSQLSLRPWHSPVLPWLQVSGVPWSLGDVPVGQEGKGRASACSQKGEPTAGSSVLRVLIALLQVGVCGEVPGEGLNRTPTSPPGALQGRGALVNAEAAVGVTCLVLLLPWAWGGNTPAAWIYPREGSRASTP